MNNYAQKRNFCATNEPQPEIKKSSSELIFAFHKHAASHLHYDFRLETEGVLKSWAIAKGPSIIPADKRQAIMVEDYSFCYKDFEDIIPERNYGA